MRSTSRTTASAVVGGLVLLCLAAAAGAQTAPASQGFTRLASLAPGSIQGFVQDERGVPVAGALVSALGATTAVGVTDRGGHFVLGTLSPGPYLMRAHSAGFAASPAQIVEVRPSARASSSLTLHRTPPDTASYPVLAAGIVGERSTPPAPPAGDTAQEGDDHGELAWRLRHARRSILKDATIPDVILADDAPFDDYARSDGFTRATQSSPARLASGLFSGAPFSGQVNLLATSSFDDPQELFTTDAFARSIAYVALGAPIGDRADWRARAALTEGDIASWLVAGEYTTRAPARHQYDLGLTYGTQRYDGGDFAALRGVTGGGRNAGSLYGFDTFTITPALTLAYGGTYAHYDYLDRGNLVSPRVSLTVSPARHLRFSTLVSSRAVAPGAEEFMPRDDGGVWLPPQRTFASLEAGLPLQAERTTHVEVEVERDIARATVSVRAFRQHVDDQLVTLFGLDMLDAPAARVGHYFVANAGGVDASGVACGVRTAIAGRVHGAVEYSLTRANWTTRDNTGDLLVFAPSAVRAEPDRIQNLSTSIETDVPETATHIVVLYRMSNAFARPPAAAATDGGDRPALDSRFDVQVRQALPFMDFSAAKWEMLVAVRNFFRDAAADQSVYDELLVVRPPKRIVGGLTLKF